MSRRAQPGAGAPPPDSVNLATIPDAYWRAWRAGYGEGYAHGISRALDDIDADDDRAWAELSRQVRRQASSPRYAQLCDRRGDHEQAECARDRERRNGLDVAS